MVLTAWAGAGMPHLGMKGIGLDGGAEVGSGAKMGPKGRASAGWFMGRALG